MIEATLYDREIEAIHDDLRFSISLDNMSPTQTIQMECLGYPENMIYGLMLAFIGHDIYDAYRVVDAEGNVLYDGRIDLKAVPRTFIEPCEECRKKLEALEHPDMWHHL
jgi:hypothetical protein